MGLVKFIDHRWINVFSLESSMFLPGSRQYTPNNNFRERTVGEGYVDHLMLGNVP